LGKKRIADALRAAGVEVRVHDDHFAPDAHDTEWLAAVGRRGWIVLTKDKGIRWRALECAAVMDARVRQFTLTAGNLDAAAMARAFVRALPAVRRCLASSEGGFIAKVDRGGRVQVLLTEAQWKRQ
jgi:predicted nuclease of predicted toxin-antitoxin system